MTRTEYVELIDMEKMRLILSNFDVLYHRGNLYQCDAKNSYQAITDYNTCKRMLYGFMDMHDTDGKAVIRYEPTANHPTGRLWATHFSTQGLSRPVRHTICDGKMVDLDIKNAHPILLSKLCKENNLVCDMLDVYIANREVLLEEMIGISNVATREDAKKLVLRIMNGGSFPSADWTDWLMDFYNEMKTIRQSCCKLFPTEYSISVKNKGKSAFNLSGSCLNIVLTARERAVLDRMMTYCHFQQIPIGSLCHDGLMLHWEENRDYFQVAKDLSEYCGMEVVVKPMNEKINLDNLFFMELDYPYRNYDKDILREARTLLRNFNSYNQAILFNKMKENYSEQYRYSRGKKATDGYWFEKQYNGRWFETQSPFKLSVEIAIKYPELVQHVINEVLGELKKSGDDEKKQKRLKAELMVLNDIKFKIQDRSGRNRLLGELAISYNDDLFLEKIDAVPHLIGFENGVFDVKANKFRPIGTHDYIQKSTGYEYPTKSDPIKRQFLLETLRSMFVYSVALRRSLQDEGKEWVESEEFRSKDEEGEQDFLFCMKALASTLEGKNRMQKFYILVGEGANGKSVLVNAIKEAFGQYACNMDISAFTQKKGNNNATSDLPKTKGCHILFTNESESSDALNVGQLKNITGTEQITERELYKTSISFVPMFIPFLLTNNPPRIKIDEAVLRRLQMINFPFRFFSNEKEEGFDPQQKNKTHFLGKDPDLAGKLVECAGEFFLYLVEVYNEYVRNEKVLIPPDRHAKATKSYLKEQDTFQNYIDTYFESTDNVQSYISAPLLHQHARTHYDPNLSAAKLKTDLGKLGIERYEPPNKRYKYPLKLS